MWPLLLTHQHALSLFFLSLPCITEGTKLQHLIWIICTGALHSKPACLPEHPAEIEEEWNTASADNELDTGALFSESDRLEEVVEDVAIEGLGQLQLHSISRIHRHTLTHTGLMHWESGPALAQFILKHPAHFLSTPASRLLAGILAAHSFDPTILLFFLSTL